MQNGRPITVAALLGRSGPVGSGSGTPGGPDLDRVPPPQATESGPSVGNSPMFAETGSTVMSSEGRSSPQSLQAMLGNDSPAQADGAYRPPAFISYRPSEAAPLLQQRGTVQQSSTGMLNGLSTLSAALQRAGAPQTGDQMNLMSSHGDVPSFLQQDQPSSNTLFDRSTAPSAPSAAEGAMAMTPLANFLMPAAPPQVPSQSALPASPQGGYLPRFREVQQSAPISSAEHVAAPVAGAGLAQFTSLIAEAARATPSTAGGSAGPNIIILSAPTPSTGAGSTRSEDDFSIRQQSNMPPIVLA